MPSAHSCLAIGAIAASWAAGSPAGPWGKPSVSSTTMPWRSPARLNICSQPLTPATQSVHAASADEGRSAPGSAVARVVRVAGAETASGPIRVPGPVPNVTTPTCCPVAWPRSARTSLNSSTTC